MSLTHWFDSQHSDAIAGWLYANPSYKDTEENAALIHDYVGPDVAVTSANLDAAWKQLQAQPLTPAVRSVDARLDEVPAWDLAQALSRKVEACRLAGRKGQMKASLGQFFTAAGPWLWAQGLSKK